ncbi:MAG TPA: hypothetical protein VH877_01020 [Polyangia bacterium]|jgi:hypothetical protein|nr:hypothetical protein [Polyangia bacterium]
MSMGTTEDTPPEHAEQPEFDLDKLELEPLEPEEIPEDFIIELFKFMEDVCRIEAHVWAAERALHDARMIDETRLANDGLEAKLGRERAYHLMHSIAYRAERAAERAHQMWPKVAEYAEQEHIKYKRKLEGEDETE